MAKRSAKCPECGNRVEIDSEAGTKIVCPQCQAHLAVSMNRKRSGRHKRARRVSAPDLVGKRLGEFEIVDVVGAGGMGVVYKAYQPSLDRMVALKILPQTISSNPNSLERFTREARAAAAVNHPNIIEIHSVGEDGGYHYIAMELVEGETLSDMLKRDGPLAVRVALKAMEQTVSALARAHAAGVVHRDIKPSNLLVTSEGGVKVADFGLAKRVETDIDVTRTGTAIGTALYMPPEIARGKPFDARSDLYSLGATFYHLLVGRPPHSGMTTPEVIAKHLEGDVEPLADVAPHVPPALARIIHRLLAKQPADRYQSAAELRAALDIIEIDSSQAAAPGPPSGTLGELITAVAQTQVHDTHIESHPPPTRRRRRKRLRTPHILMIVGTSMALAVGLGFVLLAFLNRGDEAPKGEPDGPPPPVWQKAWDRAQTEAAELVRARHFGQAMTVYDALGQEHRDWRLHQRIEKARADVLGQAERAWHGRRDKAKALLDKKKPADARAVLRPVIEQYGMPEYAEEARRMLARTAPPPGPDPRKWEEPWRQAKKKADGLVKQQRFGDAIKGYEQLGKRFKERELQDRVKKAIASVRKSGDASWLAVEKKARKLLDQKKHKEALAALKPVLETYGVDSLKKKAETLHTQIAAAKAKADEDTAAAKIRQAKARLATAMKDADKRVSDLDLKGAAAALAKVPKAGLPKVLTDRLATRRDEVQRLARLKTRIIENIAKLQPWLRKGTTAVPGSGGKKFKTTGLQIASANEEAITLRDVTAVGEKTRRVTWADLDDAVLGKLLVLTVSAKSGEDQLAAGLLALARNDPVTAEKHFDKAGKLGVNIDKYLGPFAETAFAKATELLDAKKNAEADKALGRIEKKYGKTPWFAAHEQDFQTARTQVKAAIADTEAEKLYAQAVELHKNKELWDLKLVVDKLQEDYATTPTMRDAKRKAALAEMVKALGDALGKFLTVHKKGQGNFQSIQAAIDAAPPNSLIEIQDNGIYSEKLVIPPEKDGLTLRGKTGCWPVVTSFEAKEKIGALITVQALRTRLCRLIAAHTFPRSVPQHGIYFTRGALQLRLVTVAMRGNPALLATPPHGDGLYDAEDSIVLGSGWVNTKKGTTTNCLLVGQDWRFGGSHQIRNCTVIGTVNCGGGSVVVDSIVSHVDADKSVQVSHCNIMLNPPFVGTRGRPVTTKCILGNPYFRDPKDLNFRLKESESPCRKSASDGGDIGVRFTPEMLKMTDRLRELRKKGIIKF